MSIFSSFTDIQAWQKARIATKEIYMLTETGKFQKDFGLKDQVRRSSVSIMSNIAEGMGRRGDKEFARYLDIAVGSCFETQSHLFVASDVLYITDADFKRLSLQYEEIYKMTNSLRRYLR